LDDDHKFKEIMKSKILRKSISLKKVDSTEGGYDVEGSINKETKVMFTPFNPLLLLIISHSSSYSFQIVS